MQRQNPASQRIKGAYRLRGPRCACSFLTLCCTSLFLFTQDRVCPIRLCFGLNRSWSPASPPPLSVVGQSLLRWRSMTQNQLQDFVPTFPLRECYLRPYTVLCTTRRADVCWSCSIPPA
ncbi:hypothetical protein BCV70DRAFT_16968 [Testicularia cyperi]|uniref:Uncharacterized protein n=1 Tax=Testicularia cyperi TaxID=1882483 RepID=A0A317XYN1_9BASI|nr:hypothetical protein BCV70DRAFT_16968 [Testicularia cyperi]